VIDYNEILQKVEQGLAWLDANARHAIECQETFAFPAYNSSIRELIKDTNKVRCYKICLEAIYFDLIMLLMRMYDSYERDTVCFKNLFAYLNGGFIHDFEIKTQRPISDTIHSARTEFQNLKGSHLIGRLKTVRHNMLAHTSINFKRNQVARYGDAEKLLEKTLPMINDLNSAILGKVHPYDKIRKYWKGYAVEFWQIILNKND
jgi:hypothetical protein